MNKYAVYKDVEGEKKMDNKDVLKKIKINRWNRHHIRIHCCIYGLKYCVS